MNKQLLIVTPNFPPEHQVGVLRAYRLAKYLPALGWKVHVLTTDVNYVHPEDPSLLESLPDAVEIHRARYIEPTARGVRMALGGRSRTRAALRQDPPANGSTPNVAVREMKPSILRRAPNQVVHRVGDRWLHNPDGYATWRRPALREARRLIREHNIPLVWTTSPDFTGHLVGAELQGDGLRWVADLRDPSVYLMKPADSRRDRERYFRIRDIEQHAATRADAVTVASEGIGMILGDMYRHERLRPVSFVPTGADVDLFPSASRASSETSSYLLFPGRITPEYGSTFLEVFAAVLEDDAVQDWKPRLLIVGELWRNAPLVEPHVRRLGIEEFVELRDTVPQQEILALLDGAFAGVLLTGHNARWWCVHAKSVEYLAMRKPVVAMLPALSESRMHLEQAGLGVFLDGERDAAVTTLRRFLLGDGRTMKPNDDVCDRFTAPRMAEAFATVFDRVLEGRS